MWKQGRNTERLIKIDIIIIIVVLNGMQFPGCGRRRPLPSPPFVSFVLQSCGPFGGLLFQRSLHLTLIGMAGTHQVIVSLPRNGGQCGSVKGQVSYRLRILWQVRLQGLLQGLFGLVSDPFKNSIILLEPKCQQFSSNLGRWFGMIRAVVVVGGGAGSSRVNMARLPDGSSAWMVVSPLGHPLVRDGTLHHDLLFSRLIVTGISMSITRRKRSLFLVLGINQ